MNFLTMEYFNVLEKQRNFTKAAAELHITQQTLSAHLAATEKELGTELFVRKNPLELTYAGEKFKHYASNFASDYASLKKEFADISGNKAGRLRIGIAHTRGQVIIPAILPAFHEAFPQVEVQLHEATNEELCKELTKGNLDVAIVRMDTPPAGIQAKEFYSEELVLCVPVSFDIKAESAEEALSQLNERPFIMNRAEDIAGNLGRTLLKTANCKPAVAAEIESSTIILQLCKDGLGACVCPNVLLENVLTPLQRDQVQVLHFLAGARYPISFAFSKTGYSWSVLADFIQIAQQAFPLRR